MGLRAGERKGISDVLALLDDATVASLTDTSSGRLVQPESRDEAIDAILAFTQDAVQFLSRRKVQRAVLAKYLVGRGVALAPSATKQHMILEVTRLWDADSVDEAAEEAAEQRQGEEDVVDASEAPDGDDAMDLVPFDDVPVPYEEAGGSSGEAQAGAVEQQVALEFVRAFFPWLNSAQLRPDHYFPDAEAHVLFHGLSEQALGGSESVWFVVASASCPARSSHTDFIAAPLHSAFFNNLRADGWLFNPNPFDNGLECVWQASSREMAACADCRTLCSVRVNSFGILAIAVHGTLHREDNLIGLFSCRFGLGRDPTMEV